MNNAMRPLFLAAAAALCAAPALRAQQPLSLQDAIARAQEQGAQARAAVGTRDAARARDRAFGTQFFPLLSVGGTAPSYTRSITPVIQPDGSTLYRPLEQTTSGMTAMITQRVPFTNTSLSFTSGLSRVQVSGAGGLQRWSSTPFQVGISQPIFRANSQRWDRAQQELRYTSAERRFLEAREDVALAVTAAYFDLYSATATLANATTNALTNDTLYTLNKGRFEVGKIGENDLLQSELALLRARGSRDDARLLYERALSQFRIVLGLGADAPVSIAAPGAFPTVVADTLLAMSQARRNSSLMSDAELSEVSARRSVSEAKWNGGAGGNLQASYGYNATAATSADVYKDLLNAQQLSLSVQIPVWQWGARSANVSAAKAEQYAAQTTAKNARAQIEHNARFAALQLTQSGRALTIAAKADTVAAKRFEVAYNRYVIGRISIDNLYLAQNEKDQALASYVQALRGFWSAYYQLRKTTLYDFERGEALR
jgi:outer membrane protein TolC